MVLGLDGQARPGSGVFGVWLAPILRPNPAEVGKPHRGNDFSLSHESLSLGG